MQLSYNRRKKREEKKSHIFAGKLIRNYICTYNYPKLFAEQTKYFSQLVELKKVVAWF